MEKPKTWLAGIHQDDNLFRWRFLKDLSSPIRKASSLNYSESTNFLHVYHVYCLLFNLDID